MILYKGSKNCVDIKWLSKNYPNKSAIIVVDVIKKNIKYI